MKIKTALFVASILIASPAIAGTIYEWKDPATGKLKAGDKPPDGGVQYWIEGQKPGMQSGQPKQADLESRAATKEESDRCLRYVKAVKSYKDPDSLRIDEDPFYSAEKDGGYKIYLKINAKNSYGAYAGAKLAYCTYRANGEFVDVTAF